MLDVAFERATIGVEEPVFDVDGQVIAIRNRPSDRMLIFLLRTKLGDRIGMGLGDTTEHGDRPARDASASAPALPSVAQAMLALEPAPPTVPPHLALTPDELAHRIQIADLADGELPPWLRDAPVKPPLKRGTNGLTMAPEVAPKPPVSPLGEEFERLLAEAKRTISQNLADLETYGGDEDEHGDEDGDDHDEEYDEDGNDPSSA